MNLIDISTEWIRNFRRFELSRVNLSDESQIGSSYREFREIAGSTNRGFDKSRVREIGGEIIELE